jgi:PleD family two-component response regulator
MADNRDQAYIVAILDDMFFASKLREAAKASGVDIEFIKEPDGIVEILSSKTPSVVIIDLNSKKIDTIQLIRDMKENEVLKGVHTIGYLPHVEKGLMKEALDAGYDIVLPRSRFSLELGDIFAGITASGGGSPLTQ